VLRPRERVEKRARVTRIVRPRSRSISPTRARVPGPRDCRVNGMQGGKNLRAVTVDRCCSPAWILRSRPISRSGFLSREKITQLPLQLQIALAYCYSMYSCVSRMTPRKDDPLKPRRGKERETPFANGRRAIANLSTNHRDRHFRHIICSDDQSL